MLILKFFASRQFAKYTKWFWQRTDFFYSLFDKFAFNLFGEKVSLTICRTKLIKV